MIAPARWVSLLSRRRRIAFALALGVSSALLAFRGPTLVAEARAQAGLRLLAWPDEDVRRVAFEELASHPSEQAVAGLVQLLDNERKLASQASRCLAAFGCLPVAALGEAAGRGDRVARFWAVRTLGRLGADAALALPAVVAALDDDEDGVRHNALYAIEAIDPTVAVQEITRFLELDDRTRIDQIVALRVLEVIGRSSSRSHAVLERLAASGTDPSVAQVAAEILEAWDHSSL